MHSRIFLDDAGSVECAVLNDVERYILQLLAIIRVRPHFMECVLSIRQCAKTIIDLRH